MKSHLFYFTVLSCVVLQGCGITLVDYVGKKSYRAYRQTQNITHLTLLSDSVRNMDISAEVDLYSGAVGEDKNSSINQFSINFDHKINKKIFLSESVLYYTNHSPLGNAKRDNYFYNEFARGGLARLGIGVIHYNEHKYISTAIHVMGGIESVDIAGAELVKNPDDQYYSWHPKDLNYRVMRYSMGNTTHFGFSWPRVKFGFGLNINYSIYNKDMIREYIIEELKYATILGDEYVFQRIDYINARRFWDITPSIVLRVMPAKHLSFETQVDFMNAFKRVKGQYPSMPALKLGLVYNITPNY
ncbi:MAG: hypothetical protein M9911_10010 [Saprospiraceae bacterium]|jgi:hypothetical protein|nr:hypothetical protein [Saprospiraceae bacterium]